MGQHPHSRWAWAYLGGVVAGLEDHDDVAIDETVMAGLHLFSK